METDPIEHMIMTAKLLGQFKVIRLQRLRSPTCSGDLQTEEPGTLIIVQPDHKTEDFCVTGSDAALSREKAWSVLWEPSVQVIIGGLKGSCWGSEI